MYYTRLTNTEKIKFHKLKISKAMEVSNIIYAQASTVCIRNIKQAKAHQNKNINVHLFYSGRSPNKFYGYGDEFYSSIIKVHKKYKFNWKRKMKMLINRTNADIIHTHNAPDLMPMEIMKWDFGIPVIYDQHDFISGKRNLPSDRVKLIKKLNSHEKYCNENNDGAIFITEYYRKLVEKKYNINKLNISFPNFGSDDMCLSENEVMPKLSSDNNNIFLVYVGALDQENPRITRYLLNEFKELSDQGFNVDIFPSRNEEYNKYRMIKNVRVMKKQNPKKLIKLISQYDCGLTLVNQNSSNLPEELKYGFWNKSFDYIMAGIPQISLNMYEVMSKFILEKKFGLSYKSLSEIEPDHVKLKLKLNSMDLNILQNNKKFTFETKINVMHKFYGDVIKNFHKNKIKDLEKIYIK